MLNIRVASSWPLSFVSISYIGLWAEPDPEVTCCPDAKDGPYHRSCFCPLHWAGVEDAAVADKPRTLPKPCRLHRVEDVFQPGHWQMLVPTPSSASCGSVLYLPAELLLHVLWITWDTAQTDPRGRVPPTERPTRAISSYISGECCSMQSLETVWSKLCTTNLS